MKNQTLRCKPASIPRTRWASYATAAAATALAGSQSAEAAVHYSGHLRAVFRGENCSGSFRRAGTFQLDQPGNSLRLERLVNSYCHGLDLCSVFGIVSAAFRGPEGQPLFSNYVSKLSAGQKVSSGPFTSHQGVLGKLVTPYRFPSYWTPGSGFIGFRFNNGAGVQYGWARITLFGWPGGAFRLLDYAYADPGEPIRAGQISSGDGAVEQNSVGWLALGAAGLLAWRKSRSRTPHVSLSSRKETGNDTKTLA